MPGVFAALTAILIHESLRVIMRSPQPLIISFLLHLLGLLGWQSRSNPQNRNILAFFRLSINLRYLLLFQWHGHEDDSFFDDPRRDFRG